MNRYIIEYALTPGQRYITTASAVLAEGPAEAQAVFLMRHPDREIVRVLDATERNRAQYGSGWYTDEENAEMRENLRERYRQTAEITSRVRQEVATYEPGEYAAALEYLRRRESETTPNAEGLHVGDMLCCSWGYEQTNLDYYQVTALRGAHTIVVARLKTVRRDIGDTMTGLSRPIRDGFKDDTRYTLRTRMLRDALWINSTGGSGHLIPWKDGQIGEYSSYA